MGITTRVEDLFYISSCLLLRYTIRCSEHSHGVNTDLAEISWLVLGTVTLIILGLSAMPIVVSSESLKPEIFFRSCNLYNSIEPVWNLISVEANVGLACALAGACILPGSLGVPSHSRHCRKLKILLATSPYACNRLSVNGSMQPFVGKKHLSAS